MENGIIYLFGYAGTGKYTVASEIAKLTGAIIVDNQLINTPVFKVVGADGKTSLPMGVWREIAKIRDAVFNAITYLASAESSFILTNELFHEDRGDHKIFNDIELISETRKAKFLPVRLLCKKEELVERVQSPDRLSKFKETSLEKLEYKLEKFTVLKPSHPNTYELDISSIDARVAAKMIIEQFNLL